MILLTYLCSWQRYLFNKTNYEYYLNIFETWILKPHETTETMIVRPVFLSICTSYFPLLLINLLMCARAEHYYISTRKPSCNFPYMHVSLCFVNSYFPNILNIELVSKISSKEIHMFTQIIYPVFILKYMVVWSLRFKVWSLRFKRNMGASLRRCTV